MSAVSSQELLEAWEKVKKMGSLPEPPAPKVPAFTSRAPIKSKLLGIQHYLSALEYNYTGTLYFDVNKNRSFKSIVGTAKEVVADMLPIQCLEAVFVAAYLTASFTDIERFPLSFKTECGSTVHRHIVLAVRHQQQKWGALGLSRSDKLMYKELRFNAFSELMQEFRQCFESVCHKVTKVYLGFPFPHDIHSSEKVEWRILSLPVSDSNWSEVATHVDNFAKESVDVLAFKRAKGTLPDNFLSKYPLHTPEKEGSKKSPDRRGILHGGSFEFPSIPHEDSVGNITPPPAAVKSTSPEDGGDEAKKPNPILVAPDHLIFKHALANQDQVLPTNIFLQNTTTSPFSIVVDEPTGQLDIVTKSTSMLQLSEDGDQTGKSPSTSVFRVSPKGMIVIAIKCKQLPGTSATSNPGPTGVTTVGTATSTPARKGHGDLKRTRTPRSGGAATSTQKPEPKHAAAIPPPRNVVIFRCTRVMKGEGDDQANEFESTETYVNELPFSIVSQH